MVVLRRLLSILLLISMGLLWAVPLAAAALSPPESSLPACCRRGGQHHCTGSMVMGKDAGAKPIIRAPLPRCPYAPTVLTYGHLDASPAMSTAEGVTPIAPGQVIPHAELRTFLGRLAGDSERTRGPPLSFNS